MEIELKELTNDQIALLRKPLPPEAIKPHPTKSYLSTIKAPYVIERFNDVFGTGKWSYKAEVVKEVTIPTKEGEKMMIVMRVEMYVPEYNIIVPPSYGGNDNEDLGDAYKGAITDAITKIGSFLGVGMDVYKGLATSQNAPRSTQAPDVMTSSPEQIAPRTTDYAAKLSSNEPFKGCDLCGSDKMLNPKTQKVFCKAKCFAEGNEHLRVEWTKKKQAELQAAKINVQAPPEVEEAPPVESEYPWEGKV